MYFTVILGGDMSGGRPRAGANGVSQRKVCARVQQVWVALVLAGGSTSAVVWRIRCTTEMICGELLREALQGRWQSGHPPDLPEAVERLVARLGVGRRLTAADRRRAGSLPTGDIDDGTHKGAIRRPAGTVVGLPRCAHFGLGEINIMRLATQ
jgi:hypothetical protein